MASKLFGSKKKKKKKQRETPQYSGVSSIARLRGCRSMGDVFSCMKIRSQDDGKGEDRMHARVQGRIYHMHARHYVILTPITRNGYLMRRLVGEAVRSEEDKRLTETQLLEMLGLESIQSLIRKRKLQWVVH